MKSSKQAEAPFVESPAGMGADCCFTYDGIQLPVLGGIAPGDTIFVRRTNATRSDGPIVVQLDGENILCRRSEPASEISIPHLILGCLGDFSPTRTEKRCSSERW